MHRFPDETPFDERPREDPPPRPKPLTINTGIDVSSITILRHQRQRIDERRITGPTAVVRLGTSRLPRNSHGGEAFNSVGTIAALEGLCAINSGSPWLS
jgi:hypothetical protein